jgi:hypothetical protein
MVIVSHRDPPAFLETANGGLSDRNARELVGRLNQ